MCDKYITKIKKTGQGFHWTVNAVSGGHFGTHYAIFGKKRHSARLGMNIDKISDDDPVSVDISSTPPQITITSQHTFRE